MALKLYYHPLASFCHKALIALYEGGIAFEPIIVDLGDAASSAAFRAVWPMAKMPVLRDDARNQTVAESTIVIEYLDAHYGTHLVPADADLAWQARMWDRVYDHYVQEPMQKIVVDRLRPAGQNDAFGVAQAEAQLREVYGLIERQMEGRSWAVGETFTLADCAASPALFYANTVVPFDDTQINLTAYLDRLMTRPSFARVLAEAQPYFSLFPLDRKPQITRPGRAATAREMKP
jgi:glutathione S-transferase